MKRALAVLFCLSLAACAPQMKKLDTGEVAVGDRLLLTLDGAWNHLSLPNPGPAQIWTMEGLPIDELLVYSGIKDDQAIHAERAGQKTFKFQSKMQPDQVVAMFEGMLTRDGSTFTLTKLEPMAFSGEKGFRFQYSLVRKLDHVHLSGVGYGVVSKGELFAIIYKAPRLTFFPRHESRVEQIARNARLKM